MTGARASMDLLSKDDAPQAVKLTVIGGRADDKRQAVTAALGKTNQFGPFQDLDGHWFETTFKKGLMSNFPVTMVKYKGRIPKIGETDAHDVPEDTYMFFEDQTNWSKKYLTYGWSEEEKKEGNHCSLKSSHILRTEILRVYFKISLRKHTIQSNVSTKTCKQSS